MERSKEEEIMADVKEGRQGNHPFPVPSSGEIPVALGFS